jgi:hypothetical protein
MADDRSSDSLGAGKRARRRRAKLVVFIVVVVVLSTSALVLFLDHQLPSVGVEGCPPGTVGIAAISCSGNSSGYLAGSYGVGPADCDVLYVSPGTQLTLTLFLHSSDRQNSQMITSIEVQAPFSPGGLTPAVPATIVPGGNASFAVSLFAPREAGSYYPKVAISST